MSFCESMILNDNIFDLLSYGQAGETQTTTYNSVYIIVDNGHLNWSCTIPLMHITNNIINKIRWLQYLESIWKDVECTFGILKGC